MNPITRFLETEIPVQIRAGVYLLPLFLQWLIPLTWERTERAHRAGMRGFALFVLFCLGMATLYTLALFFPGEGAAGYAAGWVVFGVHTLIALAYAAASILLAQAEFRSSGAENPRVASALERFLDSTAIRLERALSR